jgi:hypothetical protein
MKKTLILGVISILAISCVIKKPVAKSVAYKKMYTEKPITILIMPPINRSNNVEAKEFFHSTLHVPISNGGYYVIPPFLSMEILKSESAYDSELFINTDISKFGEVFGADVALFTIVHKWEKNALAANIKVEIEYIFKSTKTNEILYSRKGNIVYSTQVVSGGGLVGLAINAINTAATQYVEIARKCNALTFTDLPCGKYGTEYEKDGEAYAGDKEFSAYLGSSR